MDPTDWAAAAKDAIAFELLDVLASALGQNLPKSSFPVYIISSKASVSTSENRRQLRAQIREDTWQYDFVYVVVPDAQEGLAAQVLLALAGYLDQPDVLGEGVAAWLQQNTPAIAPRFVSVIASQPSLARVPAAGANSLSSQDISQWTPTPTINPLFTQQSTQTSTTKPPKNESGAVAEEQGDSDDCIECLDFFGLIRIPIMVLVLIGAMAICACSTISMAISYKMSLKRYKYESSWLESATQQISVSKYAKEKASQGLTKFDILKFLKKQKEKMQRQELEQALETEAKEREFRLKRVKGLGVEEENPNPESTPAAKRKSRAMPKGVKVRAAGGGLAAKDDIKIEAKIEAQKKMSNKVLISLDDLKAPEKKEKDRPTANLGGHLGISSEAFSREQLYVNPHQDDELRHFNTQWTLDERADKAVNKFYDYPEADPFGDKPNFYEMFPDGDEDPQNAEFEKEVPIASKDVASGNILFKTTNNCNYTGIQTHVMKFSAPVRKNHLPEELFNIEEAAKAEQENQEKMEEVAQQAEADLKALADKAANVEAARQSASTAQNSSSSSSSSASTSGSSTERTNENADSSARGSTSSDDAVQSALRGSVRVDTEAAIRNALARRGKQYNEPKPNDPNIFGGPGFASLRNFGGNCDWLRRMGPLGRLLVEGCVTQQGECRCAPQACGTIAQETQSTPGATSLPKGAFKSGMQLAAERALERQQSKYQVREYDPRGSLSPNGRASVSPRLSTSPGEHDEREP
eukprot:gnl/MRDRNA2_/MRDRNA2_70336_c0_seq2.p1 gnl/MRDRNA2_/MRDRNA2_70336_c0~~gnl/MRDRNA2_/MRDRNA2_70336_c0_seq2.p1  ORF type:complete len:834 (-),score=177.75 gnl/MRDRNA2_/MRDRNA2_70336_c0_seq2:235-2490(-)